MVPILIRLSGHRRADERVASGGLRWQEPLELARVLPRTIGSKRNAIGMTELSGSRTLLELVCCQRPRYAAIRANEPLLGLLISVRHRLLLSRDPGPQPTRPLLLDSIRIGGTFEGNTDSACWSPETERIRHLDSRPIPGAGPDVRVPTGTSQTRLRTPPPLAPSTLWGANSSRRGRHRARRP